MVALRFTERAVTALPRTPSRVEGLPATGHLPVSLRDDDPARRLTDDLRDSYDEGLELELDDRVHRTNGETATMDDGEDRRSYFRELFRLQGELAAVGRATDGRSDLRIGGGWESVAQVRWFAKKPTQCLHVRPRKQKARSKTGPSA